MFTAIFAFLLAAAFLFCGPMQPAQAAPILKWKIVSWSMPVNPKYPSTFDFSHRLLVLKIQYTNISQNRLATGMYNKVFFYKGISHIGINGKVSFTKPTKFKLYPGQSTTITYKVKLTKEDFYKVNSYTMEYQLQNFNNDPKIFIPGSKPLRRGMNITHTFGVMSRPL